MGKLRDIYQEERRQQIITQIQHYGRISVAELSQCFNVSEVTIRIDLQDLAKRGLVVRTHGGAVPANNALYEHALAMRQQRQIHEKNMIGKHAALMVADDDAIFLDSSSTSLAIAQNLKNHRRLTMITNGLTLVQEMMDAPDVRVVMVGSILHRDTASLVQNLSKEILSKFNIQKGFFGATGLTVVEGLTDVSADEAEVKRLLIPMCRQVIAVVDATKWGRIGLASFVGIQQINTIITDSNAPADMVDKIRSTGVKIFIV